MVFLEYDFKYNGLTDQSNQIYLYMCRCMSTYVDMCICA